MKYNKDELRAMAKRTLEAKRTGDHRYFELVMIVSAYTGLNPSEVERNIGELAK